MTEAPLSSPVPPAYPAGPFTPPPEMTDDVRDRLVADIAGAPRAFRAAAAGLTDVQLDRRYRNWTVRQIVHHVADSHLNVYIRFKLALTEERPTVRPYDEGAWSDLLDSRESDIEPSLLLLDGIHARWTQLLRSMTASEFERSFVHPELGEAISLNTALAHYAWHGRHHTAQIHWMRKNRRL